MFVAAIKGNNDLFITTLVHVATNEFIWVAQREKLIDNKP
jgi:hypothetical protein